MKNVNRTIITPKIIFDDKIIKGNFSYKPPGVEYKIFWSSNKPTANLFVNDKLEGLNATCIKKIKYICFAGIGRMFNKNKHNCLYYKVTNVHSTVIDKMFPWISILIREKIFPKYCNENMLINGAVILDVAEIPIPTLYAQLSLIRYLREYPETIVGALYLIKSGIDFFPAVTFCLSTMLNSTGHSFVPLKYPYGGRRLPCNEVTINAGLLWAVRELLINGTNHSKYYFSTPTHWKGWTTIKTVENIEKKVPTLSVTLKELLRPDLSVILKCSNEKRVTKFFNEYKNLRKCDNDK